MKKRNVYLTALFVAIMTVVFTSSSSAAEFTVDTEDSSVVFMIEHLIGFNFGHIKNFDGMIKLNKDKKSIICKQRI